MSQTIIKQKQKKSKKKLNLPAKKIWMIIGLSICSVALIGGGIWRFIMSNKDDGAEDTNSEQTVFEKKAADIKADWSVANSTGDYESGKATLSEKADNSSSPDDKSKAYMQLAQFAVNNNDNEMYLEYALKAEEESPTHLTARMCGDASRRLGDKDRALEYYKISLERVGEPVNDERKVYFIMEINEKIEELNSEA